MARRPCRLARRTVERYVTSFRRAGFRLIAFSECAPRPERFGDEEAELARRKRIPCSCCSREGVLDGPCGTRGPRTPSEERWLVGRWRREAGSCDVKLAHAALTPAAFVERDAPAPRQEPR